MERMVYISLPQGLSMPALGYGTWQACEDLEKALDAALTCGYRHIDTAWVYNNEHIIGKVIKRWIETKKVAREELFIVTKLPLFGNRPSDVSKYLNGSLEKLQLTYVDLYLIHAPFGIKSENSWEPDLSTDIVAIWKEMEKQVDAGKTKAIGVSNFNQDQIERILKNSRISPATNQIELHAYLQQPTLVKFLHKSNIAVTAYSPLGSLGSENYFKEKGITVNVPKLLENAVVVEISKKHQKTPGQVLLRHSIQKGFAAIPKSTNPERIRENICIFDFKLDSEDMDRLNNLDKNLRIFAFDKIFKGVEKHPEYPFDI